MKKKSILFLLVLLSTLTASAYDVQINGIYYNFVTETKQAEVTGIYSSAEPRVIIPATVTYNGVIYNVTSIGREAFQNLSALTSVTIPNSVTSIGTDAFRGCSSLTSVTIPNNVKSIGYRAFYNCSGLTSVTIGSSVTSIGENAFSGCSGLTSVTIPNSVTSIGEYAFNNCSGLTSVTIGSSVTSIGRSPFYNCTRLTFIIVERGNTKYDSRDNCNAIIETSSNTLIIGLKNTVIPNSVTSIGDWAFYGCSGLTSVTIPNSVKSIGIGVFYNCSGLKSVTIPNSVTSIGERVFYNCSGLTSVTIPNSVTSIGNSAFENCSNLKSVFISYGVTSIGAGAFENCSGLTSVTIPNSVTSIGGSAFYNCSGLTSVTIPNSVTSIGGYAFSGCSGLKSVTIPNSVTSIGRNAFSDCSGLTSVTIPNKVTSIAKYAFYNCSGLTSVTIGSSVTSIGERAFQNCSGLKSVTIPNSVTSIGDYAFYWCHGMTSVTIPNSVTSIGGYAFSVCSGLTSVHIADLTTWCKIRFSNYDSNPLYYAHHLYLNGSEVKDLVIPNSVTSIGDWAFYDCSGLTSVTIPNSVTSIGSSAFDGCSGLTFVTCEATSVPSTGSNVFYDGLMNSATLYVPYASVDAYKKTAPWSGFGTIEAIIFKYGDIYYSIMTTKQATVISGKEKYTGSVNIPETVIYNDETYSVTSIGDGAFENCSGLTSVTIPNSVTSIGNWAFSGCSRLTSVTIPNSVTSIGNGVFYNCSGLINVYCHAKNVPSTGSSVFYNVPQSSATLFVPSASVDAYKKTAPWSGFGTIGVFYGGICYKFDKTTKKATVVSVDEKYTGIVNIPETVTYNGEAYSVTSIGSNAFNGCTGMTSIEIPNSVTSIGDWAFYGCSSLTSVHIKDLAAWCKISFSYDASNPLSYAHHLFMNGNEVKDLVIPNSVTSIGNYAFQGCSGLTSVTIPSSVTSIGSDAFYNCSSLTSVRITDIAAWCKISFIDYDGNPLSYAHHLYLNGSEVKDLVIPNSVTSIGGYAFYGCSGLTSIEIPNSVTSIRWYAFSGCSGLTSVTIGSSVASIGYEAFYGCSGLTSITIPNSVTSISSSAFAGCSGLTSVTCEATSVPSTGSDVFYNVPQSSATLYVPASALETYKKAYSWSSFGTIKVLEVSGTCGDNVYYTFNYATGVLKITGTGAMNSYNYDSTPWYSYNYHIKSVEISDGVTSIGSNAFYNCSGLTSVTIPNSVTSIGNWAFSGCSRLTSVTIPNSVKSIGNGVFYNCSGLINVYCHAKNVPSTGSSVFYNVPQSSATLYVPASALETYKKTAPWSGFGNIIALPEPLNYYDYGLTMKTLIYKTEWADVLNSAPNAVAVAEAELEEWAASQTNVIVKIINAYYCPNFILTDLTEIAGSGYEKTGFYSPYEFTAKKGSYRRQAYAGYNTICVPFSFTASDLSGTAKTYAFEHYDDGEGKAIFKRVTGTIAAGTPCIVKESGNVVWNINLANKKISASSSSEDSHMRGTFVSTDVYQGKGYSPNSVNEFSPLSQYLHPFRACLILGSVSGARAIRLVLDDAVTDIDEVEVDSATLKDGKYLEKGKLIIYKSGRKYNANGSTIK